VNQEGAHNDRERAHLEADLQQARQRTSELESRLEALELDSQRVHRLLDEFGVPRHMDPADQPASAGRRERPPELSLLGRVSLVLEDEEDDQ